MTCLGDNCQLKSGTILLIMNTKKKNKFKKSLNNLFFLYILEHKISSDRCWLNKTLLKVKTGEKEQIMVTK